MRRRSSPFTVVSATTPLAGYDPVGEPSDAAEWRLACFAKVVHVADAPAFGSMLAAWRGEPRSEQADATWRGLLGELDVPSVKQRLKSAGVEVVVAKDPDLHGYVASIVGTEVPGDLLLDGSLEGWLKALALARHQAAVRLPQRGDADGFDEPNDSFRRRVFAEAVRDLSPTQMVSAIAILTEMPMCPGGPEPEPSLDACSIERLDICDRMKEALRGGDQEGSETLLIALKSLPPQTVPTTWAELADEIDLPALREAARKQDWETELLETGGTKEALLSGEPTGIVGEEEEVILKALALAQHESARNLLTTFKITKCK